MVCSTRVVSRYRVWASFCESASGCHGGLKVTIGHQWGQRTCLPNNIVGEARVSLVIHPIFVDCWHLDLVNGQGTREASFEVSPFLRSTLTMSWLPTLMTLISCLMRTSQIWALLRTFYKNTQMLQVFSFSGTSLKLDSWPRGIGQGLLMIFNGYGRIDMLRGTCWVFFFYWRVDQRRNVWSYVVLYSSEARVVEVTLFVS